MEIVFFLYAVTLVQIVRKSHNFDACSSEIMTVVPAYFCVIAFHDTDAGVLYFNNIL